MTPASSLYFLFHTLVQDTTVIATTAIVKSKNALLRFFILCAPFQDHIITRQNRCQNEKTLYMVSIYFGGATTQPPVYLKKKIEEENKYANGFIEGKLAPLAVLLPAYLVHENTGGNRDIQAVELAGGGDCRKGIAGDF
jgi:hypothetical protein